MNNAEKITKQIKQDILCIKRLREQKRAAKREYRAICEKLRTAKAHLRYDKGQLDTAKKLDIINQALKDLSDEK